ncbi:MAG TPA: sulfite exporter TauE/SafE family protein [Candidatus Lambdaproteobacteria bacterium]|nr:sulfite exporter TauE/SafE family protein [SAR324 cluster bacterium]HHZ77403.1 sulfite exporter TauE/SafE family protein [Candidatus Lambdaproteobacteria bacterium]HIN48527.1 sulfite exporter TauE/SafE family protein [Deltaproteobacteria bacterium]HIA58111.1 sulfite exporter TauE/SafE family protein [Candidatus Lambdaproteobacteria bacterium]HIB46591.1 sulfite exporter TauE/SafE family protein [Candidatus Lambdaproteobacteria bacterium]
MKRSILFKFGSLLFSLLSPSILLAGSTAEFDMPWWGWPTILFFTTFFIGVFGVMAGIGGGVLFVPLASSFFPFHIDFVRGTGLFIALGSSLAAAPHLLEKNLASLKLALPSALVASTFAIVGAFLGLWLSALNPAYIQGSLGVTIIVIVFIMLFAKNSEHPDVTHGNYLTELFQINGIYTEETTGKEVRWTVHKTTRGMLGFVIVGLLAGIFGLGAGWANVAILNLIMGAPVKIAVATSSFALSITDSTAAWIYMNKGAVLPILTVPSMVGIMLGAKIGSKLLPKVKPSVIRNMVIGVLFFAGVRSLMKAFGI